MAEGMLADTKLEVANVASATLSGMLKAAPAEAAAATRARFLDAASAATSSRRKARSRGASSAGEDVSVIPKVHPCCYFPLVQGSPLRRLLSRQGLEYLASARIGAATLIMLVSEKELGCCPSL